MKLNCYLVEFQASQQLTNIKTDIWSDSRFRSGLLGKIKLTVIWSDSRLHNNLLTLNCYLVRFQVSLIFEVDEVNYYLVGLQAS